MTTFRCAAILFDLDGVLVDSTGSVDRQWRIWARERGVDEEEVIAIAHGVRAVEVVRAVAPHLDAISEVRRLEAREAADRDGVVVMPGAVDLLRTIPRGLWSIVTSGSRSLATGRLQRAGVPIPKIMVTADDVVNGKPDPEPYMKGAELLRRQSLRMFGDRRRTRRYSFSARGGDECDWVEQYLSSGIVARSGYCDYQAR